MKDYKTTLNKVKKLLSKEKLDEYYLGLGTGKKPMKSFQGPQESQESTSIYDLMKDHTDEEIEVTTDQKKAFLEAVGMYNKYADSIYREHSLKEIVKEIHTMGKLAEQLVMTENDDWFDKLTAKKDMQELKKSVVMFEKTAKEASQLQNRLESLYESIGTTLGRYFEINDVKQSDQIPGQIEEL